MKNFNSRKTICSIVGKKITVNGELVKADYVVFDEETMNYMFFNPRANKTLTFTDSKYHLSMGIKDEADELLAILKENGKPANLDERLVEELYLIFDMYQLNSRILGGRGHFPELKEKIKSRTNFITEHLLDEIPVCKKLESKIRNIVKPAFKTILGDKKSVEFMLVIDDYLTTDSHFVRPYYDTAKLRVRVTKTVQVPNTPEYRKERDIHLTKAGTDYIKETYIPKVDDENKICGFTCVNNIDHTTPFIIKNYKDKECETLDVEITYLMEFSLYMTPNFDEYQIDETISKIMTLVSII